LVLGVRAQALRIPGMTQAQFTCSAVVRHLPEHSQPQAGEHAFAYTITVHNTGTIAAQLIARQWWVTDAHGRIEEVRGLAVVGQQPFLKPGERFEYTSWTRIASPQGSMRGVFFCITEDADWFEAPVPEFMLALASALH
jgi:ApaG protein